MQGLSLGEALAPANWPVFALVSGRVTGLVLTGPLWAMSAVPRTVRGALVVTLSLLLLPLAPRPTTVDAGALALPIAAELLVGVAVGLAAAVLMHAMAVAGEVAAVQTGLNLGPVLSPMGEGTVTGVGELKSYLALALYVSLGGHLMLVRGLGESLVSIPPGGPYELGVGLRAALTVAGTVFGTAVRAAAPVMVAMLLANLALAILSRAVPQLNAMAVAFPVTIGLGLVVLGASLPLLGGLVAGWVGEIPGRIDLILRAFAPAGR
ncbi:MAG TPA: flagellar biosynthetic protein FliR [Gemmatimonadales bacterium]|nr:flagellar biosynthetic protein FliR [Gemmatimonadales bacterium]